MDKIAKESEIRFKIGLDDQMVPTDIKWMATDSEHKELKDTKSMAISIWDPVEKQALGINLWTKDMMVDEMHAHFFQSLVNLTRSYHQATGNPYVLDKMKELVEEIAKKTAEWEESKK